MLPGATGAAEARLPLFVLSNSLLPNNDPRVSFGKGVRSNFGQNLKPLLAGGAGLWQ